MQIRPNQSRPALPLSAGSKMNTELSPEQKGKSGASGTSPLPDFRAFTAPAVSTRVVTPSLDLKLDALQATVPADWGNVSVADRKAASQKLQTLARDLQAQKLPGVEIWGKLTEAAIDNYQGKQLNPQRQADFAMQDLAVNVIGKDAFKHLEDYKNLPWVRTPDPMVKTFQQDWAAMGLPPKDGDWDAAGWAGKGLDTHFGDDFRPEINDKTDNQIFHTLFYQFMGYVTQSPVTIRGGSIVHELRDEGTSSEDHNAAYVGMTTGMAMRDLRDSGSPDLKNWDNITLAAYGKNGGPEVRSGQANAPARDMHQLISNKLKNQGLIWKSENLLIDGAKWLQGVDQKIRSWF